MENKNENLVPMKLFGYYEGKPKDGEVTLKACPLKAFRLKIKLHTKAIIDGEVAPLKFKKKDYYPMIELCVKASLFKTEEPKGTPMEMFEQQAVQAKRLCGAYRCIQVDVSDAYRKPSGMLVVNVTNQESTNLSFQPEDQAALEKLRFFKSTDLAIVKKKEIAAPEDNAQSGKDKEQGKGGTQVGYQVMLQSSVCNKQACYQFGFALNILHQETIQSGKKSVLEIINGGSEELSARLRSHMQDSFKDEAFEVFLDAARKPQEGEEKDTRDEQFVLWWEQARISAEESAKWRGDRKCQLSGLGYLLGKSYGGRSYCINTPALTLPGGEPKFGEKIEMNIETELKQEIGVEIATHYEELCAIPAALPECPDQPVFRLVYTIVREDQLARVEGKAECYSFWADVDPDGISIPEEIEELYPDPGVVSRNYIDRLGPHLARHLGLKENSPDLPGGISVDDSGLDHPQPHIHLWPNAAAVRDQAKFVKSKEQQLSSNSRFSKSFPDQQVDFMELTHPR